jgi:cysteine-rich repeat protein
VLLAYFFIATRNCHSLGDPTPWLQMTAVNFASLSCVATGSCVSTTFYTLNTTAMYCAPCDYSCLTCLLGALPGNCTSCDPTLYRALSAKYCLCQTGYVDIGVPLCAVCANYIAGCSACVTTTSCTNCTAGFYLISGVCQCAVGFLVTGVCTTIYGCSSATSLAGTVYCLTCNSSQYYSLTSNHSCTCMNGYYINALYSCVAKCGDGLLVVPEACDDGNLINGDGCSSSC